MSRLTTQAKGLGKSIQSSLAGFGFAGTIGGALLGKQSIDAASDLNESLSKVNVVFKEGAADVEKWSTAAATGLGISKQAALEAAGTFGNFLISMGLVPSQAQKMSVSMVQLAADLASFNNTSPEEALLAIRSGLAGEIEPLRRYGVALSAARIEQEASAQGIHKTNAEMSAAEKATFAYQIILKDTALAQGDFERTSGGLANQQRILAARLKDAEAQLGGFLVPILLTGAKAAVALGHGLAVANKATDGWLGSLAAAALVGGGVALAVSKIASGLSALIAGFGAQTVATTTVTAATVANTAATEAQVVANQQLTTSSVAAGSALRTNLAQGFAAVTAGFLLGKKAGDEINKLIGETPPKVDALAASLIRLGKGQTDAFDFAKFGKDFRGQVEGNILDPTLSPKQFFGAFTKQAHDAKADLAPLNDALKAVLATEGVDAATRAYGSLFQGLQAQGVAVSRLTQNFAPFQAALDLANAKEIETSTTTKGLTLDFKALADSFAKEAAPLALADQLDAAQSAVKDLEQLKLDAAGRGQRSIDAARNEKQAQDSLSDAYDAQGNAAESLLEAKRKLSQFDSATDQRIRTLEREQITSRIVTTPEEARQKEIDLLKFDEDAADRRESLQKQVASAEDGVASAAGRVEDAQRAVSEASAARRQVQVDAAEGIRAAERRAEEAVLAAGDAILQAKDKQLIGNDALAGYLGLLDGMADRLDPGSPLSQRLDVFLGKLALASLPDPLAIANRFTAGATPAPDPLGIANLFATPPAPAPALPPGPAHLDYHPTINVQGSDIPTTQTLDVLNRKQGIRLTSLVGAG